jgi:hypothetical protein
LAFRLALLKGFSQAVSFTLKELQTGLTHMWRTGLKGRLRLLSMKFSWLVWRLLALTLTTFYVLKLRWNRQGRR